MHFSESMYVEHHALKAEVENRLSCRRLCSSAAVRDVQDSIKNAAVLSASETVLFDMEDLAE